MHWFRRWFHLDIERPIPDRSETDRTIRQTRQAQRRIAQKVTRFQAEAQREVEAQRTLRAILADSGLDYSTLNKRAYGRPPKGERR